MWTFSNSTWKGQLKNVQDEISRPLGSREIQKTKVETVLRDTLYFLVFKEWGIWTSLHTNFQTQNFIFMNMKQDIYKNLQKFLHSHLQFSSIFRNYLPETKVFSSSVPQENPPLGPFHLFSEQVPVCGIIGIGLFQRKSRKCRKCIWKNSFNS